MRGRRRWMRVALLLLTGTPGPAADAPALSADTAPGPLATLVLADGPTLAADWHGSLYDALAQDPTIAAAQARLGAAWRMTALLLGCSPEALGAHCGPIELDLDGLAPGAQGPRPVLAGAMHLTADAPGLLRLLHLGARRATVPGAQDAVQLPTPAGQRCTIACQGDVLALGVDGPLRFAPPATPPTGDLALTVDLPALLAQLATCLPASQARLCAHLARASAGAPPWRYQARVVPEGLQEQLRLGRIGGLQAVDREVLQHLPASMLLTLAVGVDGRALWAEHRDAWLGAVAAQIATPATPITAAGVEQEINGLLAMLGLPVTFSDCVAGCSGTVLVAIGQGVPMPTVTLALPRSPPMDALMGLVARGLQVAVPAEGTSALLPLPSLPLAVNLIRAPTHWVLSTDPAVTTGWTATSGQGWSASEVGRRALALAPEGAVVIGASDTAAVARLVADDLRMGAVLPHRSTSPGLRLLLQLLPRVAALAKPGAMAVSVDAQGTTLEDRGVVGLAGIPPLVRLVADAVAAQQALHLQLSEARAAERLAQTLLPAERTFQARRLIDQAHDGHGQYALLSELAGTRTVTAAPGLALIAPDFATGTVDGWRYHIFLPDGHGGAVRETAGDAPRTLDPDAAALQERHFVIYAWPEDGGPDSHVLALLPDGIVRAAPFSGDPPEWSDVFGGGSSWDAPPAWQPYTPPASTAARPAEDAGALGP